MFPIIPCIPRQLFWNRLNGLIQVLALHLFPSLRTYSQPSSHLLLPHKDDPFLSSLQSFPPPLDLISYPSHYVSPPSPILLLNRTHWPWLICCIWLNERSFTYLITMATGINDRWPLGRNTEVLKKTNWIFKDFIRYSPSALCTRVCYFIVCKISLSSLWNVLRWLLFISVLSYSMPVCQVTRQCCLDSKCGTHNLDKVSVMTEVCVCALRLDTQ